MLFLSRIYRSTIRDINSRCKITAFFAHKCAYIKKKCVKIDTFCKKISRANIFICVCARIIVTLRSFLKNHSNKQFYFEYYE